MESVTRGRCCFESCLFYFEFICYPLRNLEALWLSWNVMHLSVRCKVLYLEYVHRPAVRYNSFKENATAMQSSISKAERREYLVIDNRGLKHAHKRHQGIFKDQQELWRQCMKGIVLYRPVLTLSMACARSRRCTCQEHVIHSGHWL